MRRSGHRTSGMMWRGGGETEGWGAEVRRRSPHLIYQEGRILVRHPQRDPWVWRLEK